MVHKVSPEDPCTDRDKHIFFSPEYAFIGLVRPVDCSFPRFLFPCRYSNQCLHPGHRGASYRSRWTRRHRCYAVHDADDRRLELRRVAPREPIFFSMSRSLLNKAPSDPAAYRRHKINSHACTAIPKIAIDQLRSHWYGHSLLDDVIHWTR